MVNRVTLIGRLGKDPEMKHTPGGATVCKFSVATSERFKDRAGEQQEKTEWHNIVAWDKLAENCAQFLHKGSLVYLEGKIQSRQYEDRSGVTRLAFEIVAREVKFLTPKDHDARPAEGKPVTESHPVTDEDIPF